MASFMVASMCCAVSRADSAGTPAAASPSAIASGVNASMICSPRPGVCHCCAMSCQTYSASAGPLPRAPVVADEIDGRADALDLAREPVDVRLLARGEARRQGASEARQRRRDDVGAPETGAERRPEAVRVGDTVDEEGRHERPYHEDQRPRQPRPCMPRVRPGRLRALRRRPRKERVWRWLGRALGGFVALTVLPVVAYRFIDPHLTPLMLIRALETRSA